MKNSKLLLILVVIASIALLTVVGANVYAITKVYTETYQFVSAFSICITCIFSIYYMVSGCNKEDSAKFFKIFMVLFALNQLVSIYGSAAYSMHLTILSAITYGFLCILTVAKDLGKTRSLTLAILVFLATLLKSISIFRYGVNFYALPSLTSLLISLITILMIVAKYKDKEIRGSK